MLVGIDYHDDDEVDKLYKETRDMDSADERIVLFEQRIFFKELDFLSLTFGFNPLSPAAWSVFNQTLTHITFMHELLKSVKKRPHPWWQKWAGNQVSIMYSQTFQRDFLFSLCVSKTLMIEVNRMLGDVGVQYNKIALMANYLTYIQKEVLTWTSSPIVRENIINANGHFAQIIALGRDRLRKNKDAKKTLKSVIKVFLEDKKWELTKGEILQSIILVMQCMENDVLTPNKTKKFFKQIFS